MTVGNAAGDAGSTMGNTHVAEAPAGAVEGKADGALGSSSDPFAPTPSYQMSFDDDEDLDIEEID